jgi:hypothetical protein
MVSSLSFFVPKGSKKDSIGVKLDSAGLLGFTPIESFFDPFGTKKLRLDTIGDVLKR